MKAIASLLLLALCAVPQEVPFNGKDMAGWRLKGPEERSKWKVGKATLDAADPHKFAFAVGGEELVNTEAHSVDAYTEAKWGDCLIEVEVMVPKGSNSGIYVMGEYEVQVLDSFGKEKVGQGASWWARGLGDTPVLLRAALAFSAAFLLLVSPRLKAIASALAQKAASHRWWPWLILQLAAIGLFALCTAQAGRSPPWPPLPCGC